MNVSESSQSITGPINIKSPSPYPVERHHSIEIPRIGQVLEQDGESSQMGLTPKPLKGVKDPFVSTVRF